MPILRRPQRVETSSPTEEEPSAGPSPAPEWRPRERSGEYRILAPRRPTTKMWAQRPPASTATLPSMNAVRHARAGAAPEPERPRPAIAATLPDVTASNELSHALPLPSARELRELDDFDFLDDPAVTLDLGAVPVGHAEIETIAGKLPRAVRFTPQPMEAVKAPPSSGRGSPVVDDRPADDAQVTTLADPIASRHEPPSPGDVDAAPPAIIGVPAFDPRPGIVAFAGFGLAPEKLSEMPAYALRVFARRRILRAGLEVARQRRPQDVELYQSAIVAADEAAVRRGLVLLAMLITAMIGAIVAAFELVT